MYPACPSSSKKAKDKINRSQSQRPAGDQSSLRLKDAKEAEDAINTDTRPYALLEPDSESKKPETSNVASGPTSSSVDLPPSDGCGAELQPKICDKQGVTEAGADSNPEKENSSPPLSKENDEAHAGHGLEPKEESREATDGAETKNQESDSIYRWSFFLYLSFLKPQCL